MLTLGSDDLGGHQHSAWLRHPFGGLMLLPTSSDGLKLDYKMSKEVKATYEYCSNGGIHEG